ncbi:hypothetical protein JCM11641_003818 [Rhodosporidiobolus odoratus]
MLLSSAFAALLTLTSTLSLASPATPDQSPTHSKKPNIVFNIVDDQDARQNSIGTMQRLQRLLAEEGTVFDKFYAPISVCCPSRTSFLRAQCAHNANITSVMPPFGGWAVSAKRAATDTTSLPLCKTLGTERTILANSSRASFNPDVPSGASWVRQLQKLNQTNVEYIEEFYRGRLQSLQAVDDLVEGVVKKLEELGVLDETIVIYTATHSLTIVPVLAAIMVSKRTLVIVDEEDINVPLVVRGPGVPAGLVDCYSVYSLSDLGATILHLAGATSDFDHDGSIVPLTKGLRKQVDKEGGSKQFHLAEYWVEGVGEGGITHVNQTYRAITVVE